MKKRLIAPSILSADFSRLGDELQRIASGGADWVHIDVMDGHFVPNITMGPLVVKAARAATKLFLDVHLMISEPEKFVKVFADAGADLITFHIESCDDPKGLVAAIRALGKKVGVSIKPKTALETIEPILGSVDLVLVMTVEPGFAGQSFMKELLPKITALRKCFDGDIEVDGGIAVSTAPLAFEAGANVLVAGTAVFGTPDYGAAIRGLRGIPK